MYLFDKLCNRKPAVSFTVVLQALTVFAKEKSERFLTLGVYQGGPYKVKCKLGRLTV